MDKSILVEVDRASKKFCRDLKRSLWYGVRDITSELVCAGKEKSNLRPEEFWALENISFKLQRGECLGVIGNNGAGKSTLLKMIGGLIRPDKGKVTLRGSLGSLIELGAGFNPILTGRENIYINASILGIPKREVDKKFNEIVEFADIAEFIDTPVQNYSSGMKVRLGFAIAIQMEPDILLIDEVLAVGDIAFQQKSWRKIKDFIQKDKSAVFVSHNLQAIKVLCSRALWVDVGRSVMQADSDNVIAAYITENNQKILKQRKRATREETDRDFDVKITEVSLEDTKGKEVKTFDREEKVCVRIKYFAQHKVLNPSFGIGIFNWQGVRVTSSNTQIAGASPSSIEGEGEVKCVITSSILLPGNYSLWVGIKSEDDLINFDRLEDSLFFTIREEKSSRAIMDSRLGVVYLPVKWIF